MTAEDDRAGGSSPIDSQVLLHAAALASVGPERLPGLLDRAQAHLADEIDTYRRRFECVYEDDELAAFVVPADHWEEVGEELSLGRRAADAVQRAHEQQLRRLGGDLGRREEFETALEIRSAVIVGLPDEGRSLAGTDAGKPAE